MECRSWSNQPRSREPADDEMRPSASQILPNAVPFSIRGRLGGSEVTSVLQMGTRRTENARFTDDLLNTGDFDRAPLQAFFEESVTPLPVFLCESRIALWRAFHGTLERMFLDH